MYCDLSAVIASFSSTHYLHICYNLISKIQYSLFVRIGIFYSERSTMAVRENLALIMEVRFLPL